MGPDDLLRLLEAAEGDPALLALATIDITFPELTAGERAALRHALEVAAVPHWCNERILAVLLDVPAREADELWRRLYPLTVVEPFTARGRTTGNVHEATRLALRRRMASDDPARLRHLSRVCADYFGGIDGAFARIEHLYNLVVARPDEAAALLRRAECTWVWTAHHRDRFALVAALEELVAAGMLGEEAELTARLISADERQEVPEATALEELGAELLAAARALGNDGLIAAASRLVGDAMRKQGRTSEALAAYEQALGVLREGAETRAADPCWQRRVAVIHSRIGDVAEDRGDLQAAKDAYGRCVEILDRLSAQDPDNTDWRRNQAVARSRFGDIAFAREELDTAEEAFAEGLAAFEELSAAEPGNSSWKRDLAVAYERVGEVEHRRADHEAAEAAFGDFLATMQELVSLDGSNPDWQRELACAYLALGRTGVAREQWERAQQMLDRAVGIFVTLAGLDPSNAKRQIDWAVALSWAGSVVERSGDRVAARAAFAEAVELWELLVAGDPTNRNLAENLEIARTNLAALT